MENDKPVKQCSIVMYAISAETPVEFHDVIVNGVEYWNEILDPQNMLVFAGPVEWSVDSPYLGGFLAIGVVPTLERTYWHRSNNKQPCGRTYMKYSKDNCIARAKIKLNLECAEDMDEFETIVRHEIGHILGLSDNVDFTSLMSHNIERTMQHPVDANDEEIKAVRALYGVSDDVQ